MDIQSFKNALTSPARPNLFRVRANFPNAGTSVLGTALGAAGGAVGGDVGDLLAAGGNVLGGGGPARQMEFLCKGAQLPPSTLGTIEVPYRGRVLKYPGDRTFTELNLTILADNDFLIRNSFESWMDLINSHEQNVGPNGMNQVTTTFEVDQLDKTGAVVKTYRFEYCFPIELGEIDLNHDSSDTISEYSVSLSYSYWTSDTTT